MVPANGEHRFEPEVNPAALLFHQSVYTVHSAVRVSCAATQQAVDGLPTWSISTAYQGSLLALRALLGLCGIAYLELEGCFFLMDTFPSARKGKRKKSRAVLRASTNEVQLMKVQRMEHRHWWLVFQRILRTSAGLFDCWWVPFDSGLAHCTTQTLSKHRNELHYHGIWFYDDLFDELVCETFGRFDAAACKELVDRLNDENGSDGALILNQTLLAISIGMLRDLAKDSRRVEPEVDVIERTIRRFSNRIISTWSKP